MCVSNVFDQLLYYHSLCLCTATELHCRTRDDMGRRTLKGKYLTILTYQMWPIHHIMIYKYFKQCQFLYYHGFCLFHFRPSPLMLPPCRCGMLACFIDPISYAIDPIICLSSFQPPERTQWPG